MYHGLEKMEKAAEGPPAFTYKSQGLRGGAGSKEAERINSLFLWLQGRMLLYLFNHTFRKLHKLL